MYLIKKAVIDIEIQSFGPLIFFEVRKLKILSESFFVSLRFLTLLQQSVGYDLRVANINSSAP